MARGARWTALLLVLLFPPAASGTDPDLRATRFGCGDGQTPEYSREAFQRLHRRFPGSRWTNLTPYWYRNP